MKKFKKPLLYNLGRLVSYTVMGGIIGGIGSIFSINYYIQSIIILIAAICMICMSLSMFLFCLGTIPLMLFFGSFINFAKGKTRVVINKIASVLILILSLAMLNRALVGFGINIGGMLSNNSETQYIQAEMMEDYQYVKFDLNYDSFQDVIVKKGIPVKMIINVELLDEYDL